MDTFTVHILAADRTFYEGPCESLVIPASDGERGIWAHHANMIAAVVPGRLRWRAPGQPDQLAAVSAGMIKVEQNDVLVLGALGLTNMWAAVFADVGVSVIAILNASRMLRAKA